MQLTKRTYLPTPALIMSVIIPLIMLLPAHAGPGEYKLLELDGHKVKWGDQRHGPDRRARRGAPHPGRFIA